MFVNIIFLFTVMCYKPILHFLNFMLSKLNVDYNLIKEMDFWCYMYMYIIGICSHVKLDILLQGV